MGHVNDSLLGNLGVANGSGWSDENGLSRS